MGKTLYMILGVPQNATEKEIKAAHRTLVKKYHPDTGVGSSEDSFRVVQDAYDTLVDPAKRASYDRSLLTATVPVTRVSSNSYSGPGAPEPLIRESPRMSGSHIDLSHLSTRRGEPIRTRHRHDPFEDIFEFLRRMGF